jgi:hypothetical protein
VKCLRASQESQKFSCILLPQYFFRAYPTTSTPLSSSGNNISAIKFFGGDIKTQSATLPSIAIAMIGKKPGKKNGVGDAMIRKPTCILGSLLIGAVFMSGAEAVALTYKYTYTGNNFLASSILDATPPAGAYTATMQVSGDFTLATPLPPNLPVLPLTPNVTPQISHSRTDAIRSQRLTTRVLASL